MQTAAINLWILFIVFFGGFQKRQAGAYFKNFKDRDVVSSPIKSEFNVEGYDLTPSASIGKRVGHHHLLVNLDSIMERVVIPGDVNHIYFENGKKKER